MKLFMKDLRYLLIPMVIFLLFSCFSPAKPAKDLIFFYFETCPSCDDYIMAQKYSQKIVTLDKSRTWKGASYNLITPEAAQKLKSILQDKGLPDISRSLPLLIIGSEYINGYDAIGNKLEELSSHS